MVQITARKQRSTRAIKRVLLVIFVVLFTLFVFFSSLQEDIQLFQSSPVVVGGRGIRITEQEEEGTTGARQPFFFLGDLHHRQADSLWIHLLQEAESITSRTHRQNGDDNPILHIMEVGMRSQRQCVNAAKRNLYAHCVEPSPSTFERVNNAIKSEHEDVQKNIRLYQMAASGTSGEDIEFASKGDIDHVGRGVDVWTMAKADKPTPTVALKSVAIDDIIDNSIDPTIDYASIIDQKTTSISRNVDASSSSTSLSDNIDQLFLLKIDTEGHEPIVFSGLHQSIRNNKIDFILMKYWPKGIDFINDTMGSETECQSSVEIIKLMYDAGYTLYTIQVSSHPRAPMNGARLAIIKHNREGEIQTPLHNAMEHCRWFYDLERNPKYHDDDDDEYKMGYWTDILAVAPSATLGEAPVSASGKIIAEHLKPSQS